MHLASCRRVSGLLPTLARMQFPSTLEKGLNKLMSLKDSFGGMVSQASLPHTCLPASFSHGMPFATCCSGC